MKENRKKETKNVSILNPHFLDTVIKNLRKSTKHEKNASLLKCDSSILSSNMGQNRPENRPEKNRPRIHRSFNTKLCFLETVLKYDPKSTPKKDDLGEPVFENVLHSRAGANQSRNETAMGWKTGFCKVRNTLLL